MIRSTIRARPLVNGVSKVARKRFSTQDWEGLHGYTGDTKLPFTSWQPASEAQASSQRNSTQITQQPKPEAKKAKTGKSAMEAKDEELRLKLEGISGDGGVAGLELENGKAVGLKRGVKENMFRVI